MRVKRLRRKRAIFFLSILGIFLILITIVSITTYHIITNNKESKKQQNVKDKVIIKTVPLTKLVPSTPIPKDENEVIDNETPTLEPSQIFQEKHAMVVGDSMAEGLSAYEVLDQSNVVWVRGRRIDTMKKDLPKVIEYQPNYLFLAYGINDLELWNGRVESFINSYRETLELIKEELPNTVIIINSILPVSKSAEEKQSAFKYQKLFNKELKKLAKELDIPFLENSSYLLERENPYTTDGIHPKAFFFEEWGKHMSEFLSTQQ